ncbi:helix-turn-helix domain-containing protein [Streptomyces sp. R301]|uniref:helix-turn-helix domain-containing protein n=1 Tax=unclassified Streptomyces TaxID=2593676 RepID=UPI003211E5FA
MDVLLTTSQAAAELGCAVTTFRRLVHAGLIPGVVSRGVRVMVPLETVQALRTRRTAALHRLPADEIAVLRVRGAESPHAGASAGRQGFSAAAPTSDLLANLRGWWRCDAPSVAAGGVLPVTVAGYVVAVLTNLHQWETNSEGRTLFSDAVLAGHVTDLARPTVHLTAQDATDRATAQLLLGARLASDSGGPIAYVSTRNPDVTQG